MTFVCNVKLSYDWAKKVAVLSEEKYLKLRDRVTNEAMLKALVPPLDFDATKAASEFQYYNDYFMDESEVTAWADAGVELTMSRIKGLASPDGDIRNTIYQISVANVGLMQIQTVDVLENCCTDELQRWLDNSWRILAVCPPNDARRPSYVMGHFEKDATR